MRLPGAEVELWMAYRRKYGPLVLGGRIDRGFAMIAHLISVACGNKRSTLAQWMPDYSPVVHDDNDGVEATLDDLIEDFGATICPVS